MRKSNNVIDNLYTYVESKKLENFQIGKDWDSVMSRFINIDFVGEVDQKDIYISMLHQVVDCRNGRLINLTREQADEYHTTGDIKDLDNEAPYCWTFWKIDSSNGYINVFTSFEGQNETPKENYARAYSKINWYRKRGFVLESNIAQLRYEDKQVFLKLLETIEYSKTNYIREYNFSRKVNHAKQQFYGIENNKGFIADPYIETAESSRIELPQKHNTILIRRDLDVVSKLKGPSFNDLDFETNALIKSFPTLRGMTDYFYSLIDFIMANKETFNLSSNQDITEVHKYWYSNDWESPRPAEEREKDKQQALKMRRDVTHLNSMLKKVVLFNEEYKEELNAGDNIEDSRYRLEQYHANIVNDYNMLKKAKEKIMELQAYFLINDPSIKTLGKIGPDRSTIESNADFLRFLLDRMPTLIETAKNAEMPPDEEKILKDNKLALTKYEIAITKYKNKVYLRANVMEYGISYYLSTYNERPMETVNNFKKERQRPNRPKTYDNLEYYDWQDHHNQLNYQGRETFFDDITEFTYQPAGSSDTGWETEMPPGFIETDE